MHPKASLRFPFLPALLLAFFLPAAAEAAVPERTSEPDMAVLLEAGKKAATSELMPGMDYRLIEVPDFALKVHAWSFDQGRFSFRMAMQKTPKPCAIGRRNGVDLANS